MERRNTVQKDLVRNAVLTMKRHVTAEEVYEYVRQEHPVIGKGTVYRNLGILSEEGSIRRIEVPNGPDRFDGNIHPHCHFLCKECGKVLDIDVDPKPELDALANSNFGGMVDSHVTLFLGQCPNCYH